MAKPDSVYSLFGMKTPQQVAAEEYKRAFSLRQPRDPYQALGQGMGELFGTLFRGESEEMKRAKEGEEIIQSTSKEFADIQEQERARAEELQTAEGLRGTTTGVMRPATEQEQADLAEAGKRPEIAQFERNAEMYDMMAERLQAGGFADEANQAQMQATQQRVKGFQMQKMIREEESAIAEQQRKAQDRQLEARRRVTAGDILERRGKPDMAQAVREGILPLDTLKEALKEPEADYKVVGKSLVKIPAGGGKPVAVFSPPPEPNTTYTLMTEQEIKDNPTLTPGVAYQKNNKTQEITAVTGDPKVTQVGDYQVNRAYDAEGNLTTSMAVIPGSKTDRDLKQRIQQTSRGIAGRAEKLDLMSTYTDRTIELLEKNPEAAGWQGAAIRDFGDVPFLGAVTAGSPTEILDGYLTVIKSNIGFDKLQRMRDESPTGGALGQVAILELIALQNSIAPLEPKVGDKVLIQSLKEIRDTYTKNMEILANNYTNEVLNQYGMQIAIQYRTVDPVTGKPLQPEGSTEDPLGIR
jgi:hypothetical protein